MIRINLLPHRERKRERRKKEFVGLAAACAAGAGVRSCRVIPRDSQ